MKRTIYPTHPSGLLADSDLVRSRPHSRTDRSVFPMEPVIQIDIGDPADAVDSGCRNWTRDIAKVA